MLCCICLTETSDPIGICEDMGKKLNIAEIVCKHFWLKLEDILSSHICTICWDKINEFHVFYKSVEKSHKDFENVKKKLAIIKEESNYFSSISIKEEHIEDDDYMNIARDLQLEIEIEFDKANSTKNPLADNEISSSNSDGDSNGDGDGNSTTSEECQPTKNVSNKNNKKPTKTIVENKTKRYKRKKTTLNCETKLQTKRKKAVFNRLDPIHTEEMIRKHIPMGCNLCVFVGKTFADIVTHFKDEHPDVRAYITCCDKTFTKRFYVAQHAMTHENPTCFSCLLCNKSFTTTGGLQKHNLKYHAPDEERTFACELCPEKFARQHLLQLHTPSHIPREEWNFFCNKCPNPKAFASAYLLNIHDNKLHKREKNICNVCAKEIKDKKSFEKHVREHNEGSGPRLKCPISNCDSWLKDEDNLKVHLRRHNAGNEPYKCPLCDKICPNRRALSSHKVYVHTKEVFKCEHCDKTFKRAITLREHMTQHTGEVLYNCPFCTRTFNSNANMHSHKKKQHPVEWEALRRQKMGSYPSETTLDISKIC